MSDNRTLLKTLGLQPSAARPHLEPKPAESDEDQCQACGYLRGVRDRALHIQFRLQTGECVSYPYSWLGQVSYHPSKDIVLTFVGDKTYQVTIRGRNLAAEMAGSIDLLNSGILRHRVVWVREMEPEECSRLPDEALIVERITIEAEQTEPSE